MTTIVHSGLQDLWCDTDEVMARLREIDVRFRSFSRDLERVRGTTGISSLESDFQGLFQQFREVYARAESRWGSACSELENGNSLDRQLDAYFDRFRSITGQEPTSPTRSDTGGQTDWITPLIYLGVGTAAIFGIAYLLRAPAVTVAAEAFRRPNPAPASSTVAGLSSLSGRRRKA